MLKNILCFGIIVFSLLYTNNFVSAANIDGTSKYAWSESVGWFDFSNVTVADSELTGYAYNDNTGWLSLNCSNTSSCGTVNYSVTNDGNGNLDGDAWSESLGWFDFNGVSISTDSGDFSGYAYNDNTGWLSLNCSNTSSCGTVDYKVSTTWAGISEEGENRLGAHRRSSGGGSSRSSNDNEKETQKVSVSSQDKTDELIDLLISLGIISEGDRENIENLLNSSGSKNQDFLKDLELGDQDSDVKRLQEFLNTNGYILTTEGLGSIGDETTFFGSLTVSALIKFQSDNSISPAVGYFGPITRSFINNLLNNN